MSHCRVTGPLTQDPARNHVVPCWPTMQFSPVVSSNGLIDGGIDSTHCHHSLLSWGKAALLFLATPAPAGRKTARTMAAAVGIKLRIRFMVSSSLKIAID